MLCSMTGFGSALGEVRGFKFRLEAKSLNHRFLEIRCKLPEPLFGLEPEIERLARKYFERGKIEILVMVEAEPEDLSFSWSRSRAKAYLKAFDQMKRELGIGGDVNLELLLSQKDVMISEPERWGKGDWRELEPIFRACFEELLKARAQEGERLAEELKKRLFRLEELVELLKGREELVLPEARAKLKKRIEKILNEEGLIMEEARLEQEVILWATRSDFSEEVERIKSHLKQFQKDLTETGAKGKKLEFLTQELNREFNTISAKSQNPELSHWVVEAKTELERIRQQLQNIE